MSQLLFDLPVRKIGSRDPVIPAARTKSGTFSYYDAVSIVERALDYREQGEDVVREAERLLAGATWSERRRRLLIEDVNDDGIERAITLLRALWEQAKERENRVRR